jgi:hypothetical protein
LPSKTGCDREALCSPRPGSPGHRACLLSPFSASVPSSALLISLHRLQPSLPGRARSVFPVTLASIVPRPVGAPSSPSYGALPCSSWLVARPLQRRTPLCSLVPSSSPWPPLVAAPWYSDLAQPSSLSNGRPRLISSLAPARPCSPASCASARRPIFLWCSSLRARSVVPARAAVKLPVQFSFVALHARETARSRHRVRDV